MDHTPEGYPLDAWALLSQKLSQARQAKMRAVVSRRTGRLRLVLQDLYDQHNIAACLRSAEALGILYVDVVDKKSRFMHSNASRGAKDWLIVRRWPSEAACAAGLKAMGYRIIGAYPSQDSITLGQVPIDQPLAVVFGNEHEGLSSSWDGLIDQRFTIPMYGMVESFNISVAAAITMFDLSQRGRSALGDSYTLNHAEQVAALCSYVCKTIPHFEKELSRLRAP